MGAIVNIPNTNFYFSGVIETSASYQYHRWNILDARYTSPSYQLQAMSIMGFSSPDLPATSAAYISNNKVLLANPLRIVDYTSLTPPILTTT